MVLTMSEGFYNVRVARSVDGSANELVKGVPDFPSSLSPPFSVQICNLVLTNVVVVAFWVGSANVGGSPENERDEGSAGFQARRRMRETKVELIFRFANSFADMLTRFQVVDAVFRRRSDFFRQVVVVVAVTAFLFFRQVVVVVFKGD